MKESVLFGWLAFAAFLISFGLAIYAYKPVEMSYGYNSDGERIMVDPYSVRHSTGLFGSSYSSRTVTATEMAVIYFSKIGAVSGIPLIAGIAFLALRKNGLKKEKLADPAHNLSELRAKGHISDEEYSKKKKIVDNKDLLENMKRELKNTLSQLERLQKEGILTEEELSNKKDKAIKDYNDKESRILGKNN